MDSRRQNLRELLERTAQLLNSTEDEILRQSLRSFLRRQLRIVKTKTFQIQGRYGVSSVEEMEACYRDGTLVEADSWQDLQRLDHLEYRQAQLTELLKTVL